MSHTEVHGGSSRVVRIHAEAHAQKLDVSFDVQRAVNIDLALCVSLVRRTGGQLHHLGCAAVNPAGSCSGLTRCPGEVHLQRASRSSEASLSFTERSEFFAASFRN